MARLYCLLVTVLLMLCLLIIVSYAFIIKCDAVAIMLCIHTNISYTNVIVFCTLIIIAYAVGIILCLHGKLNCILYFNHNTKAINKGTDQALTMTFGQNPLSRDDV